MGALNTFSRRILLRECVSRSALPGGVQPLILLPRLEPCNAGRLLRPRILHSVETWVASFAGKARLSCHTILGIGVREPEDALLAHRARDDLTVPVDGKLRFVEPYTRLACQLGSSGTRQRSVTP